VYSDPAHRGLTQKIENADRECFSSLELPDYPTVYDHLLLSLRRKDAIFTFNWDPFLFDACARNPRFGLPRLLYPIRNKNYASYEFIASGWDAANWYLESAFTLTIVGYGAPARDTEAVDLMKNAWNRVGKKLVERVEIIDIKSRNTPYETWKSSISYLLRLPFMFV
jgi:hypothetical protein